MFVPTPKAYPATLTSMAVQAWCLKVYYLRHLLKCLILVIYLKYLGYNPEFSLNMYYLFLTAYRLNCTV